MFESNSISNSERTEFNGHSMIAKSILSIFFSLFFGSLIATTGFIKSILVVLMIVIIRIALSFIFKDQNFPKRDKTDIKKYIDVIKDEKNIKQIYKINFFNGLTYSKGAFQNIISIYIIKVFSDSFSLRVFTSIFSLISCAIGYLFANHIKKRDYSNIIKVSMTTTIISLIIMVLNCNMVTIVLFNFFKLFQKNLLT